MRAKRGAAVRCAVASCALAGCLTTLGIAAAALAAPDDKIADGVVRIGLILDMSQALSYLAGESSVTAARMAVEDFGGQVLGYPIEIVSADHQNRADLAAQIAREWFDAGKVDALMDVTASPPALAVAKVAREKNRILVVNGAGTLRLTNEACNAVTMHWAFDSYALAEVTVKEMVRSGNDTWYFVTAENAFGQALEKDAARAVRAEGGKVLGSSMHAIDGPDFSAHLLRAKQSGAKVIGLATAGKYFIDAIQAAHALGIANAGKQRLAASLIYVNDIHSVGLAVTQGLHLASAFYWDSSDEARKWSKRFFEREDKMPNMAQAGVYSATLHYLKAVQAAGTDRTEDVVAKMRELPVDFFGTAGRVREDGRMVHDMYLFEVKSPAESGGALGLSQAARDRSWRASISAAREERVPAAEEIAHVWNGDPDGTVSDGAVHQQESRMKTTRAIAVALMLGLPHAAGAASLREIAGCKPGADDAVVSREGLFTTHVACDHLLLEIPDSLYDRDMLLNTEFAAVSGGADLIAPGTLVDNRVVRWTRRGNTVNLENVTHDIARRRARRKSSMASRPPRCPPCCGPSR